MLDLGCGTGILGLLAARKARRVVAVDVNPKAVECTRFNAEANGLEAKVDVRLGSLFQPLKPGEAFNLILFNPPYLPGKPRNPSEAGWLDSGETALKFLREASRWLKPGGLVQLVYSSLGALSVRQIVEAAEASKLKLVEQKAFRSLFETFTIHVFALREGET
ncbi:MAG: methyltransferase [Candidatus Hecatellales archaeon B24]|nr:MAG: methyltransferase [Candidatus Hecatellales archaeon B24]